MIAVDTNILVYAHREDAHWHHRAARRLTELAEAKAPWAIPWQCVHEFLGVVTHPRIYQPPTPLMTALEHINALLQSPSLMLLTETPEYWPVLEHTVRAGQVLGPRVHDGHVAAICRLHGVSELWSADRDFSRFPDLVVRNPLIS